MLVNSAPTDNAMITIFVEVSKIVSVSVVPAAPPVTYLLLLLGSCPRWCRRASCGLLPAPALGPGLHGLRWLLAAAALDTASWATELLSHAGHPPLDFDSGVLIKQTRPVSPRLARTAHWALVCRPPGPYPTLGVAALGGHTAQKWFQKLRQRSECTGGGRSRTLRHFSLS